jgi:hypothetical protein
MNDMFLVIRGTGFPSDVLELLELEFSSNITRDTDYSVYSVSSNAIVLQLMPHRVWMKFSAFLLDGSNFQNPQPLMLTSMRVQGRVSTGSSNKGIVVGMIYLKPMVIPKDFVPMLEQTQSQTLTIPGYAFLIHSTFLEFDPPLVQDVNYTLSYLSRDDGVGDDHSYDDYSDDANNHLNDDTDSRGIPLTISKNKLLLTLQRGSMWSPYPSPLMVTGLATYVSPNVTETVLKYSNASITYLYTDKYAHHWKDKANKEFTTPTGWTPLRLEVANVTADRTEDSTADITVFQSKKLIYENALRIDVFGEGFVHGMKFAFNSTFTSLSTDDYVVHIINSRLLYLNLQSNALKWTDVSAPLVIESVTVGGVATPMRVQVAMILETPTITPDEYLPVHQTQTKFITVHGTGFTLQTRIRLTIPSSLYYIKQVIPAIRPDTHDSRLVLALRPGYPSVSWAVPGVRYIEVLDIDTGGGWVPQNMDPTLDDDSVRGPGIYVGIIVPDDPSHLCVDSCQYAFDGECDERIGILAIVKNDDHTAESSCVIGTDCTDCGGTWHRYIFSLFVFENVVFGSVGIEGHHYVSTCENTCIYARDGECDDPRAHSNYCALGTDCQVC